MACVDCSAFSENAKYFVHGGPDGKLRVWNTETGILTQEYTPNLHLSSPFTCLTWVATKPRTKKKKKKSREDEGEMETLAMGMTSGSVVLYSVARNDVVEHFTDGHNCRVNHIAWTGGSNLFSCDSKHIIEWDIFNKVKKSKWDAGNERLSCLLALPDDKLIAAGHTIGLWDVPTKSLLKKYTGHASEVTLLRFVPGGENYFISAARNDRHLCAWSLSTTNKDKNAVASFIMEDAATSLSVNTSGAASMVATTRNGILHHYKHQLNGKCLKPLKPRLTVQISSDTGQSNGVHPIPILAAYQNGTDILFARGTSFFLTFETISSITDEKVLYLVREDLKVKSSEDDLMKVKQPDVSGAVEYLSPIGTTVSTSRSSKRSRVSDVPMEKRLDNLSLTRNVSHHRPHADSMAQLLMQALHSQDQKILRSVLMKKDLSVISNTVMRLPVQSIVPLVNELVKQIQRTTLMSQTAVLWLKAIIRAHAGHLLANPEIQEMFSPILGLVETRLNLLAPISRLRGRVDLLVDQLMDTSVDTNQHLGESLLVYQDEDSEDISGLEEAAVGSESEDHWEEVSEMDVETEADSDDVSMSS